MSPSSKDRQQLAMIPGDRARNTTLERPQQLGNRMHSNRHPSTTVAFRAEPCEEDGLPRQVQQLFIEAIALPEDTRRSFLDDKRKVLDGDVVDEVMELLEFDRSDSEFMRDGYQAYIEFTTTAGLHTPPTIAGYDKLTFVAEGGQAVVFRGRQQSTGQDVAVKLLKEVACDHEQRHRRYAKEIALLAQLQHPNIVSVIDRGTTQDEREYFATRFIDGSDLDVFLRDKQPSFEQRKALCIKIARAIDVAHHSQVVHRDLKPSNIRIDRHGEPHILDFGLAKHTTQPGTSELHTVSGQFLGSVPWASPEQIDSTFGKTSSRSDVYQLGVVFYQVFSGGQFPYDVRDDLHRVFQRILQQPPEAIKDAQHDPQLRQIETVLLRALQKDPDNRFASAGALANAIEKPTALDDSERTSERPARLRSILIVFCAMVLLVAGLGAAAYALMQKRSDSGPTAVQASTVQQNEKPEQKQPKQTPQGATGDEGESIDPPVDPFQVASTEVANAPARVCRFGQVDFAALQPGRIPTDWHRTGNTGIDSSEGIPGFGVVARGANENSLTNSNIHLAGEFFLEMQVAGSKSNIFVEVELLSETIDQISFELINDRNTGWTLKNYYDDFRDLAVATARPNIWLRFEHRQDGMYITIDGDPNTTKRIGDSVDYQFDALTLRFPTSQHDAIFIQNMRWGPISEDAPRETRQMLNSGRSTLSQIPTGWKKLGTNRSRQGERFIAEGVQLGERFDLKFDVELDGPSSFSLYLVGRESGPSIPVHFVTSGGYIFISTGDSQLQVRNDRQRYTVLIARDGDELNVQFGDARNAMRLNAEHLQSFERLEVDIYHHGNGDMSMVAPSIR